jgi:hypothetical protein
MMPYRECSTPDDVKAALQGLDQLLIAATARAYRRFHYRTLFFL